MYITTLKVFIIHTNVLLYSFLYAAAVAKVI